MRAVRGARAGVFPGCGAPGGGEHGSNPCDPGGTIALRALILGGARSGKSAAAERMAADLGGDGVLYVATAQVGGDELLERRVEAHRGRRPEAWGTVEIGDEDLTRALEAAREYDAALLDSLTLWVSARMFGLDEADVLAEVESFVEGAASAQTAFVVVSDEVGLGVVPESVAGQQFRDLLGEVNQKIGLVADEVFLCVAGHLLRLR